jgi:hypothetical protein
MKNKLRIGFLLVATLVAACGKGGVTASGLEGKWVATRARFTQGPMAGVDYELPAGTALVSFSNGRHFGYYGGNKIDRQYRLEGDMLIGLNPDGTEIGRSKILSLSGDRLQVQGENQEVLDYRRVTDEEFENYLLALPRALPAF